MNQKDFNPTVAVIPGLLPGCEAEWDLGPISTSLLQWAVNRYGKWEPPFMGLIGRIEDQQRGKDAISQPMMER